MNPTVIIIVEDNPGRIENTLCALKDAADLPGEIKIDAENILKESRKNCGYDFESIIDKYMHVKVICPNENSVNTFAPIKILFDGCQNIPAICFLDLDLQNNHLNRIANNQPMQLSAGIEIEKIFKRGFGRLLVQASNIAMETLFINPSDPDYFIAGKIACSVETAKMLVSEAITKYRINYDLHKVPEVASFIALLWRGICEKWDIGPNCPHPFHHNALQYGQGQPPTRHLNELASYLDLGVDHFQGSGGNSAKGLFEIVQGFKKWMINTSDLRDVSNEVLKKALKTLGIEAELNLINVSGWRFPMKPALPMLLALRVFLEESKPGGEVPKVKLEGDCSNGHFIGKVEFTFRPPNGGAKCSLVTKYVTKSKANTSRPHSGLAAAFWDLTRARVELNKGVSNSVLTVYGQGIIPMVYSPVNEDSNTIKLEWKVKK